MSRAEVLPQIQRLDLLVLGGGILYDTDAPTYLREVNIAHELGVPVMLYAIGAGPLKNTSVQRQVREALDKVAVISVRERNAAQELERAGVTANITVTADPALLLQPEAAPDNALELEGIRAQAGHRLVGISVREPGVAAPDLGEYAYHDMLANVADQFAEVVARGKKVGVPVFPSLKLQDPVAQFSERCGRLKWDRGIEVCLGGPEDAEDRWHYNFALKEVRDYKLAIMREVLEEYQPEGLELDFVFTHAQFFRRGGEEEKQTPTMTAFVADVRRLADEAGRKQGRRIPVMARTYHSRELNLNSGMDVERWLKDKSVDYIVGQIPGSCMETAPADIEWMAGSARSAGAAAYIRPPRRVYDDCTVFPSVEMLRALGQTLNYHGFAGMYLGYLPWPFSQKEMQLLRDSAYPEIMERQPKLYFLAPREGEPDGETTTPARQLPAKLQEGKTAKVDIFVADDLEAAKRDGEMREPLLTIRFADYCVDDEVAIRFNGVDLPVESAEVTHYRGTRIAADLPGPVQAPKGMTAHWFRYRLPIGLLKRGNNALEVTVLKASPMATFKRSINGVEILTRYKDFERPLGFGVEHTSPGED